MARSLTVSDARRDLAETLNQVAYAKETVIVERRGKALAAIVPIEDYRLYLELLAQAREELEGADASDA